MFRLCERRAKAEVKSVYIETKENAKFELRK